MSWPFNTNNKATDSSVNINGQTNRQARDPNSLTMQNYQDSLALWGHDKMQTAAPDATDEALRKRRSAAITQAGLGMGRRSTLLTGTMTEPVLQKTTLGAY